MEDKGKMVNGLKEEIAGYLVLWENKELKKAGIIGMYDKETSDFIVELLKKYGDRSLNFLRRPVKARKPS